MQNMALVAQTCAGIEFQLFLLVWDASYMILVIINAFFHHKLKYSLKLIMKESFYYSIFCKASLLSRPPGAKNHEKRNLRIQGRMQIFRTNVPEGFKSCFDTGIQWWR